MTVWRPAPTIRVKALGLAIEDGQLFAAEVLRDDGTLKGVRPLGGSVEFGETWRETLRREFAEELGVSIDITGDAFAMENLYEHEGERGHEILFIAPVRLPPSVPRDGVVQFHEHDGTGCTARWFALHALDEDGPALFPAGLKARLSL